MLTRVLAHYDAQHGHDVFAVQSWTTSHIHPSEKRWFTNILVATEADARQIAERISRTGECPDRVIAEYGSDS